MKLFLLMLVVINPFAQLVYLQDYMREMDSKEFTKTHLQASYLAYGVFLLFAFLGDVILDHVFQIHLESLQIFGGLIMLNIAYRYIVVGAESNKMFRGAVVDPAQEIALPYMVGAGTVWISILMGQRHQWYETMLSIGGVLLINFVVIVGVQWNLKRLEKQKGTVVGKYFSILQRTMALFIGAVGVEMIMMAFLKFSAD